MEIAFGLVYLVHLLMPCLHELIEHDVYVSLPLLLIHQKAVQLLFSRS